MENNDEKDKDNINFLNQLEYVVVRDAKNGKHPCAIFTLKLC